MNKISFGRDLEQVTTATLATVLERVESCLLSGRSRQLCAVMLVEPASGLTRPRVTSKPIPLA